MLFMEFFQSIAAAGTQTADQILGVAVLIEMFCTLYGYVATARICHTLLHACPLDHIDFPPDFSLQTENNILQIRLLMAIMNIMIF